MRRPRWRFCRISCISLFEERSRNRPRRLRCRFSTTWPMSWVSDRGGRRAITRELLANTAWLRCGRETARRKRAIELLHLPARPAGEGVARLKSPRTASPAGRAGRGRGREGASGLAAELVHLPDKPAGVYPPASS